MSLLFTCNKIRLSIEGAQVFYLRLSVPAFLLLSKFQMCLHSYIVGLDVIHGIV